MFLPSDVHYAVSEAIDDLNFGKINLEITMHDGKPKYRIITERSFIPGKPTSGSKKNDDSTQVVSLKQQVMAAIESKNGCC